MINILTNIKDERKIYLNTQIIFKYSCFSVVVLLSKLGICDIDFFNFWLSPSQIVQNFEPIQKRLKFCSKLSKLPKAKAKVIELQQNRMKSKYYFVKFYYIS